MHDQRVDELTARVPECPREPADRMKTQSLPQADSRFVAGDDEIELHGGEAARLGVGQRMGGHGTTDPATRGPGRGHVGSIGHMRAAASLVGAKIVCSDDLAVVVRDEDLVSR
jgi:hypothetical protein